MEVKKDPSDYASLRPQDIESEKGNLKYLLVKQLDRTNYLMSVSRAERMDRASLVPLLYGLEFSLRSIEAMMQPFLDENYRVKVKEIKLALRNRRRMKGKARDEDKEEIEINVALLDYHKHGSSGNPTLLYIHRDTLIYQDLLAEWYDLLVGQLARADLIPLKKKTYDFDE